VRIVPVRPEAIAGAKLLAFGMAEAKRRGYGEDGIYFDHCLVSLNLVSSR